jgi:DsbC/DsbD-like thiol-disulfide interchange protein
MQRISKLFLGIALLYLPADFRATVLSQSAPNIDINGYFSMDKARRGSSVQGAVVIDIPSGYHVNSSHPLEKYLIATQLRIDAPQGIRIGPVVYPRALLRTFKFSKDRLSVYEGRAIVRFNVIVPAGFSSGVAELKAHLRYQSCNNELCFPPQSRDITLQLPIVPANEPVKRINAKYFGGRSR